MSEQETDLAASLDVAQINSIVLCMQHRDRILSGRHRHAEMNKKGKIAKAITFDCDALAAKLEISHEEAELWVQVNANLQRQVDEEERKDEALMAAMAAQREGVEPGKIAKRVAKTMGVSERRAQQLLPSEMKRSYEKEEEKHDEGGPVAGKVGEPQSPSALSPLASQYRVSRHTQGAQLLEAKMGYWSLHPDMDYATFPRYGEETKDGKTKSYTPDFWFPESKLILEVEGDGSASKDDKRDAFFEGQGIHVLHIPDKMAKNYGNEICEMLYFFLNPRPIKVAS